MRIDLEFDYEKGSVDIREERKPHPDEVKGDFLPTAILEYIGTVSCNKPRSFEAMKPSEQLIYIADALRRQGL